MNSLLQKHAFLFTACIGIGHLLAWAVAWTCAVIVSHPTDLPLFDPRTPYFMGLDSVADPAWHVSGWTATGSLQVHSWPCDPGNPLSSDITDRFVEIGAEPQQPPSWSRTKQLPSSVSVVGLVEDARGWPYLALRCGHELELPATADTAVTSWGIPLAPNPTSEALSWASPRALPLRPIWRGLMANTFIGGLAVFFPALCVRQLLQRRRSASA